MDDSEDIKEFPDVGHKLAAPKKISAFEKERQAQEAKQKRAEAENAAALRAFEDSFGHEDDDDDAASVYAGDWGPPRGPRGAGMGHGGRYGGLPTGPRSGPGSLGPLPGPPPPSLKRKRALDEMREAQEARREASLISPEHSNEIEPRLGERGFRQEDEQEADTPKPTVQLSSLPPRMTTGQVRGLFDGHLTVYSVRLLRYTGTRLAGKHSLSAIVTLAAESSIIQIDTAVTSLKDKYLGCGYYLSISRHLSSTALHPNVAATARATSTEPFGAERPKEPEGRPSMRNAPPPSDLNRHFAPPDQYDPRARSSQRFPPQVAANVEVRAPMDISMMRAIHTLVETLICEPSPFRVLETEAVLMAQPKVQQDERFAFLFDTKSPAAIYYRYLLWAPDDPEQEIREQKRRAKGLERIHYDNFIEWTPPYGQVPFPDLRSLAQVVDDIDYNSSDEESDDDDGDRPTNTVLEGDTTRGPNESRRFGPLKRARLVHHLSRLPIAITRLRKGDVARITNFAINHAGQGAEEIVDIMLLNVSDPFSYSLAAKYEDSDGDAIDEDEDSYEPDDSLPSFETPAEHGAGKREAAADDPSNTRLIALYVISDLLSASSTAGARNAWKYRTLFETGFRACKTFERLGRMDKEFAWGRLKSEQWKRKVGVVFGIWEGWSVFPSEVHEELKKAFYEPPLSEEEKAEEKEKMLEERKVEEEKKLRRFKTVGGAAVVGQRDHESSVVGNGSTVENREGANGKPIDDDNDDKMNGTPMEGVTATPMADTPTSAPTSGELHGKHMPQDVEGAPGGEVDDTSETKPSTAQTAPQSLGPKRRMRAEDMFASDEE